MEELHNLFVERMGKVEEKNRLEQICSGMSRNSEASEFWAFQAEIVVDFWMENTTLTLRKTPVVLGDIIQQLFPDSKVLRGLSHLRYAHNKINVMKSRFVNALLTF